MALVDIFKEIWNSVSFFIPELVGAIDLIVKVYM